MILLISSGILCAQQRSTSTDSTTVRPDSTSRNTSPVAFKPSTPPEVENVVRFQSRDSLILNLNNKRTAALYGSSKVEHPSGTLSSGTINMDLEQNTVEAIASAPDDTLSMPVLERDAERIRSNRILFNYNTQRGKFEAARIKVGEGNLIGTKVKNVTKDDVFIQDGIYSTCPPEYLYYYIKAKKMKVVEQDEIFFSNARIYILDIPYPIVFPFGYVPAGIEQKQSGLLTPTYVFDAQDSRGIGLNNLGWFQYVNNYLTTQVRADVFTSGTFFVNNRTQYRKTDSFTGSVEIGYSQDRGLEPTDPEFTRAVNRSLQLTHNQTISPYASLAASINLRTSDYYRQNSFDIDQQAETSSISRVGYNYSHPENLFTTGVSTQLTQNFFTNATSLNGPTANFTLRNLTPFQDDNPSTNSILESISIQYNNSFRSQFSYNPLDADTATVGFLDALFDPSVYREATGNNDFIQFGFEQRATASLGRIINNPFINSSANFTINEYWYPSSTLRVFNADSNRVEEIKQVGFQAAREFSTSLSFSTTLYGMSNARIGNLKGFRHTMRPLMSLSYRPDFSDDRWGYFRTVQTDTTGRTQQYNIFEDQIIGRPGAGEQRALSFSIQNFLEAKSVSRDTTGEVSEQTIRLINNFSLSSSYNFAADSLKLAPLSMSINSSAIKGITLVAGASISFYQRDDNGRQFNQFIAASERRLGQLENFNISANTSFKGGNGRVETFTPVYRRVYDPLNQQRFNPIDPLFGFEPVSPLRSPWSFTVRMNYSWRYRFGQKPIRSATVNLNNIQFNLTPKWNFRTTIGYDFILRDLTPARFSLDRNLECWDLSFQLNPFGDDQFYFFSLRLNSAQVQSLFQKLPILRNLERGSSQTGRNPFYN